MKVIEYSIPIPDYEGTGVFNQLLLVEDKETESPPKEDIIKLLQSLHEEDSKYEEYTGTWKHAIASVEACVEFPRVTRSLVGTNTFFSYANPDYPQFSQIQCLSVSKRKVHKV